MTHEERNNIVAIFSNILVTIYVVFRLISLNNAGTLAGPDALMHWARAMLWILPIGIVLAIVGTILASIVFAIAARDPSPSFIVDERDQMIKVFGMQVTLVVVSAGFIGVLVALAFGIQGLVALIALYFAFSLADLIGNVAKFIRYRGIV